MLFIALVFIWVRHRVVIRCDPHAWDFWLTFLTFRETLFSEIVVSSLVEIYLCFRHFYLFSFVFLVGSFIFGSDQMNSNVNYMQPKSGIYGVRAHDVCGFRTVSVFGPQF